MARHAAASSLDVVVGGGSLAGLSAALLLLRAGHNVQLYERSPTQDRSHRGAGIVLQRHVLDFFRVMDLAPPDAMSVRCERRQYLDREGGVTRKEDYTQRMTSWSVLYKALKDAFPVDRYHSGSPVSGFSEDKNQVEVQLEGGASVPADLFVAADGPRSVVRHQLLPDVEKRYAGYVAWRGVVPERELPANVAATLMGRFTFFHGPGTQILSYLIPGPGGSLAPGERDMNWVWYWNYPTDAELAPVLTDAGGQRHADALPGDRLRPQVWEQQKERARAHLPPQFAQLVALTRQPFVQTINDLAVPAMAHGRVALIGEAAFIPRPHTAASADQAFANALGLGEAMASVAPSEVPSVLKRWEAEQMQYGQYLQELGQTLGNRSQFGDPRQVLDLSKLKNRGRPADAPMGTARSGS
ncbi:hypothetical protein KFL_003450100 [Klebsormidium nitens]|uniref:2,6-dihydroxypyridine 3-monooxygenase substrate binding domain-containing protein n=1 Tax=Klebsormidium nitens TaxID=105231 RepID=A0A1Y1I8M1_KLENI|nr:hypothetical protein KFL_003450100 [Klebsormidium nitens]|eukprot:GAQ87324.1 hypothetical protein KFL_003450100 [Klebsormidium nitens]